MSEIQTPDTVPVYRVENPTIAGTPDGTTSHEELVGQWFSPKVDTALGYLRKSTQTFGTDGASVEGAQLVVAHIPADQLGRLHVSQHPIAARMDVEGDNYIVPRDGNFSTDIIPLDNTLGDLRGRLGNYNVYREARERVYALLGKVAVNS